MRYVITTLVLSLAACAGTSAETTLRDFFDAAQAGDYERQAALLTSVERDWGAYVASQRYPDETAAHFRVDSLRRAKQQPLGADTVLWEIWGTEPNWSRAPLQPTPPSLYVPIVPVRKSPGELTSEEIASLPRVTSTEYAWVTKERGRWRVTLQADRMGPVMVANDSLDRCPMWEDPRPCRATASRLPSLARSLRIYDTLSVTTRGRRLATQAALLDSLRIEQTETKAYDFSAQRFFDWVIRNDASQAVWSASIRIYDADGVEVTDEARTMDIPAHGRKRGGTMVSKRGFRPPFRYEIYNVELETL
jgi:hypothetical protein